MPKKADAAEPAKRKAYDLPGQIHDPPEENEPLRVFYETLLAQRPESEMAQIWMMEHGLLDEDDARRALVLKQKHRGTAAASAASGKGSQTTPARGSTVRTPPPSVSKSGGSSAVRSGGKSATNSSGKGSKDVARPKPSAVKRKPKAESDDSSDEDVPLTRIKR